MKEVETNPTKRGKIIGLNKAGVSVREISNLGNVPPQVVQDTIQRDRVHHTVYSFPYPVDPENSPLTMSENSSATLSLIWTSHGLGLATSIMSAE